MPDTQQPPPPARRKLTRIEVIAYFIFAVIILSLIPPITFQRASAHKLREVCAANLKMLGMAMSSYAGENRGFWPIAAHAPATEDVICAVTYAPGKIGTHRGDAKNPKAGETGATDTEMSVTRNLWTLIRTNLASSKSFVCPMAAIRPTVPDLPNEDENPQAFWDFAKYTEVSYGMQVPYGKHGRPSTRCGERMALMADKGPFGAALEAKARDPGLPTFGSSAAPSKWMRWNSPNHGGKDQNVLYADGHIESRTTPLAGCADDNIYTRWSDATGGVNGDETIRVRGTPLTSNEAPFSDTDSLIYP